MKWHENVRFMEWMNKQIPPSTPTLENLMELVYSAYCVGHNHAEQDRGFVTFRGRGPKVKIKK